MGGDEGVALPCCCHAAPCCASLLPCELLDLAHVSRRPFAPHIYTTISQKFELYSYSMSVSACPFPDSLVGPLQYVYCSEEGQFWRRRKGGQRQGRQGWQGQQRRQGWRLLQLWRRGPYELRLPQAPWRGWRQGQQRRQRERERERQERKG